jgi:dTDP-4-dehydrorhamnose reductase
MLRLAETKDELGVIGDQIGTPTYARDLAKVIIKIIVDKSTQYGIYHYSNQGVASWYDFAHEVFSLSRIKIKLNSIGTESYPTPAKRPKYSVMSKSKIITAFDLDIPHWRDSLSQMLKD